MSSEPNMEVRRPRRRRGVVATLVLHVLLPLAVLGGGYLVARHLIATAPTTKKTHRERSARAVEVVEVGRTTRAPKLEAMGLVKPSRVVTLRPRIPGEVVGVSPEFQVGGRFDAGDDLVHIDPADYDLAVALAQARLDAARASVAQARSAILQAEATRGQQQAAIQQAEANLQLEEGNQTVARRELEMLAGSGERANRELVLRAPQLAIARATVAAARAGLAAADSGVQTARAGLDAAQAGVGLAEAQLDQARLERDRVTIQAPFNAWIRETHIEVGAVITTNANVATLVGSDAYWIEVTLPVSELPWVVLPPPDAAGTKASGVVIRDRAAWGPSGSRTGRVLRLLGDVESAGRLARLLVLVEDPLHLAAGASPRYPLLTGAYVRVEITGREIADVTVLDRAWLRQGNVVWVADAADTLRIRSVQVTWRGRDTVFLGGGLESGDRVITTDLSAPVDGMPVRVRIQTPTGSRP